MVLQYCQMRVVLVGAFFVGFCIVFVARIRGLCDVLNKYLFMVFYRVLVLKSFIYIVVDVK